MSIVPIKYCQSCGASTPDILAKSCRACGEPDHQMQTFAAQAAEIETLLVRIAELEATVDKLLQHCPDGECSTCGEIVCPHNEPFHFHHDGCPACADAAPSPADSGEVKP